MTPARRPTASGASTLVEGEFPLTAENGFLPELDKIPADIARRAKVLVLNYPNNPTGASATPKPTAARSSCWIWCRCRPPGAA